MEGGLQKGKGGFEDVGERGYEDAGLEHFVRFVGGDSLVAAGWVLMGIEEVVIGEGERGQKGGSEKERIAEMTHGLRAARKNWCPNRDQAKGRRRYSLTRKSGRLRARDIL